MTSLKITPHENKTAYSTGMLVVVESCSITVTGAGSYIAEDPMSLRFRVYACGKEICRFPLVDTDEWSIDGEDATCIVNTNTAQALEVFRNKPHCNPLQTRDCFVIVDKVNEPKALLCSFNSTLKSWPQAQGEDTPYDLTNWPDDLDAAQDAILALQIALVQHDHSLNNGATVSHDNLSDKGSLTHPQLESFRTDTIASIGTITEDVSEMEEAVTDLTSAFQIHGHTGGAFGEIISHSSLSGIGTLNHDQLESSITARVIAHGSLSDHYNAHKHTGVDGTGKVSLSDVDGVAAMVARLEAAELTIANLTSALSTLDAATVKKQVTLYSVTAPVSGAHRNITENMTGDQLAASIPSIVADLQARGVL